MKFITGFTKFLLYVRIALHVALRYLFRVRPWEYPRFLRRALILLLNFRHNKIVKVPAGYKLQLYLPAYPSKAFFRTIESKLIRKPPGPATVVYSITRACNYKCEHCYQSFDRGADVSEEKLIETALQIKAAGVTMFDIEGGEPFLQFSRLAALIRALGDDAEIWVNTHGGSVEAAQLETMKNIGVCGLMISIHATDADEHDRFTGVPGSFQAACQAAQLASQLGLAVTLNSVLSAERLQAGQLDELMDLAKNLGCAFVQLIHPKPAGGWLKAGETIKQDQAMLDSVKASHLLYNSPRRRNYPALAAQVFEERCESLGCTAGGVDRFYVNAAGEVQPCEFLNISFGNVNEQPFDEIFSRMRYYFAQPGCDWLCCSQAGNIAALIDKYHLTETPIRWDYTQELVKDWDRGAPTPLYKKLGIYDR